MGPSTIRNPQRRALLVSAAALMVAGCSPGAGSPVPSASSPRATGAGTSLAPAPPPVAVTSASVEPAATTAAPTATSVSAAPSQDQIVHQFAGRVPAYWGLEAPGVLKVLGDPGAGIALTLDFCGGPGGSGIDHAALALLKKLELPATLFLNARWIQANTVLARELAAVPFFELANHGSGHLPLSVAGKSAYGIPGTRNAAGVYEEIMANDAVLSEITGKRPRFFRPGTAYLDEIATEIALSLETIPTGFSINADGGATYTAAMVAAETAKALPGDIIISHGNQPSSGTSAGLAKALPMLLDAGHRFTMLSAAVP